MCLSPQLAIIPRYPVYRLPDHLFDQLETAANAHPPQRIVNPSERWGLDYDIFDDYPY